MEDRGFLAAFTERTGGVSKEPFRALNLDLRGDDQPSAVLENRKKVTGLLDIPPFALGEQTHETGMVRVGTKRAGAGFEDPGGAIPGTDILAATRPRLPVAVLVADCVPLVLASPADGLLLVVHAGWRGLAAGIVDRAAAAFDGSGVMAALGPAIGPCHYEVGQDVALAVAAGSDSGAITERRGGRTYLDLAGTVARRLRALGIRKIDHAGLCTACERRRFFSHRRDGTTGRHAMIGMRL